MARPTTLRFRRYGRSLQAVIKTAGDLRRAVELDEAHWAATNAPIDAIRSDPVMLRSIDAHGSGRITCATLADAVRWMFTVLSDDSGVTASSETLSLRSISTGNPQGKAVYDAARKMLRREASEQTDGVTLEQVRRIKARVESTPVSEAGVVIPTATQDSEVRRFITDAIDTVGAAPHPTGVAGLDRAGLERFLTEARAYLEWYDKGSLPPGVEKTAIMPLGPGTSAAYEALEAVRAKIDQYFAQCRAVALDERLAERIAGSLGDPADTDFRDPQAIERLLAEAPLAKPSADGQLKLDGRLNPYYAEPMERFTQLIVEPVLGAGTKVLTANGWRRIGEFFAAHRRWLQDRLASKVASLGVERIRECLDERYAAAVRTLIDESAATALELDKIRLVERLILYQAHMIDLANNFIAFPHLYDPASRAMFEIGTLVMDARRFNLAVRVADRAAHERIAKHANMYLLYVQVTPADGRDPYLVAVPVTSGGKGNLCMGKRGVFIDLDGRESDAVVVGIIENPISLREALVSPFVRLGRILTGKIESLAARAEQKLDTTASSITALPGAAAPKASGASRFAAGGMLMGAGVALAALGSAMAYITKTLAQTHWLAIVIGILAAVLIVLLPTSLVAFLKLRRRDLSAILEASGWGINTTMRLTRSQSRFFTQQPAYPPGISGIARVRRRWLLVVLLAAGLAAGTWLIVRSRRSTAVPVPSATTHPATIAPRAN